MFISFQANMRYTIFSKNNGLVHFAKKKMSFFVIFRVNEEITDFSMSMTVTIISQNSIQFVE